MYDTTSDFVAALERAGELKRVAARVSPVLEITEIADRVSKSPAPSLPSDATRRTDVRHHHLGGHALLFENVEGSDFPVLINQFGSYRRMEMALGCDDRGHTPGGLEALADKLGRMVKPEPPPTLLAKLQKLPELLELAKLPPKKVRSGVCQEVVLTGDQADLTRLPLLRCWPHDGDYAALGYPAGINDHVPGIGSGTEWEGRFRGRYITFAGIHTIHADDLGNPVPPSRNIGMYRVQLLGKRTAAMHWHMHHDGARHWRSWKHKGERMPVAIALGGESVLPYAATAPMPPGISELLLAGFLNRGGIPLVACQTVPLEVPANSEIVIEGYVSHEAGPIGFEPREEIKKRREGETKWAEVLGPGAVFEGPFGDHTGFYSMPDRYPILTVTAITHRRGAIYPTTIVGLPPQEDYFMGKATERIFLPLLKTIVPDIIDYDLPMFGVFHSCAFIKIRKEYPLQARRVMHSIWGAGQMAWTKMIVVVDHDVDVHDQDAVLFHLAANVDPARDIEITQGPVDILDHAAARLGAGGKIGFDATRKIPGEEVGGNAIRAWPPILSMRDDIAARVTSRWSELGLGGRAAHAPNTSRSL
jgi:4-hydroxy-3-polyprenylbenzoate decarboxylase